jgi:dihydroneopterin aldolase
MSDAPLMRVFLRDMVLHARVGIYPHERVETQRIRINVDLDAAVPPGPDRMSRVLDYDKVAQTVREIATAGHINLVETLAERIAAACLRDPRVRTARVRVEKLDVFEDTFAAGVEIEWGAGHRSSTG